MTWKERLIGIPLALVGAVLLLATGTGLFLTHTSWGRERIRSFALEKLNGAVAGRVEIDQITEGDLLRMVRLAGVRVFDPDGERFASADTLVVHFRWYDFLIGNVTLPEVTAVGLQFHFAQSRDGDWNLITAFRSPDPRPDTTREDDGPSRRIVLRDVTIRNGDITVSTPWDPGPANERSRWHVREIDGEWRRVLHFERFNAVLPRARVAGPPGMLYQVTQLTTRATIMGDAFVIEQLRADVEVRSDTVSFDVWEADLPASRLFGEGWVTAESDPEYDIMLHGNPVQAADLQWLIPRLPPGTARLDFRLRSVPGGLTLEADNARWSSDQAELSGRFAMTTRGFPRGAEFDRVDLDVERFRVALIDSLTGWTPPLSGSIAGHIGLDGPLSRLVVDSDVRIDPEVEGGRSRVVALGVVDARPDSLGASELEVRFDSLKLDLVQRFVPQLAVQGAITGRATADGKLAGQLAVEFDLEQRDRGLNPIRLSGGGFVSAPSGSPPRVDLDVRARPLSFTTLSQYYPIPVRGDFSGTIRATGPLDELGIEARLAGRGDSVFVRAELLLAEATPGYRGEIRGWRIRLPEFQDNLPESDLDFNLRFEMQGTDLAGLRGGASLQVFPSFIGGVGLDSAVAEVRVADGRLLVDTAVAAAEFGRLRASGGLSLTGVTSDSLRFDITVDSLGMLSPWVFTSTETAAAPLVPDEATADEDAPEPPRLAGAGLASGWVVRDSSGLNVHGRVSAWEFAFQDVRADSLSVDDLVVGRGGDGLRVVGSLGAVNAAFGEMLFPDVRVSGTLQDSLLDLSVRMRKEGASAAGRLWIALGAEGETLGVDTLSLELGETTWELVEPARVRLADSGALDVDRATLRSGPRLMALEGTIGVSGPASFHIEVSGVQLADVARMWPDSLPVAGTLDLRLDLSGRVRSPSVSGGFEVVDGRLLGVSFSSLRGELGLQESLLAVQAGMWQGEDELFRVNGTMPLALELPRFAMAVPDRVIDLTIDGDSIPLSLATLLGDAIVEPRGHVQGSVHVGGTAGDLHLEGPARLVDGRFRVASTGITYEGLNGNVRFEGAEMKVDTVGLRGADGGRGWVTGSIDFRRIANPVFDLELRASELAAYDQLDARLVMSGTMQLDGPFDAAQVTGDLSVVSGVFYLEEIGRRSEIIDPFQGSLLLSDTTFVFDESLEGAGRSTFLDNATVELSVSVVRDTWLRSEEANIEIAGDLIVRMHRAQNELRIDGTLRTVRGDYRYFRRFEVVEGTIEFVGTPDLNPNLRIVTVHTVRTQKEPIRIRLILGGTLEDPTLSLESDAQPPIPESDLLSYVVFGRPSYELTRSGEDGGVLAGFARGVPQAFFGYALESILVGGTGIAYVDVSEAPRGVDNGEQASQNGVAPALTATQVEVGWYLAPTVFVSVAQHLAASFRPTVRLEWKLSENLTLRGVTEPRFGTDDRFLQETSEATQDQSIGLFLFYGWTY